MALDMSNRWLLWIALAVLLFWSVGAYNRLVRLRGAVRVAFDTLDQQWRQHVEMVRACLPASADASEESPGRLMDAMDSFWAGLAGAANQFVASLAAARARPFDPDAIAALATAREVLAMAWQRVQNEGEDLAGAPLPQDLQAQWQQFTVQTALAAEAFNRAVTNYNDGIAQFPALLLASLFAFKPARAL